MNRLKSRLNFRVLKRLLIEVLPIHVYQSALNFTFSERVSTKSSSNKAYPLPSSEFIVDARAYITKTLGGTNTKPPVANSKRIHTPTPKRRIFEEPGESTGRRNNRIMSFCFSACLLYLLWPENVLIRTNIKQTWPRARIPSHPTEQD